MLCLILEVDFRHRSRIYDFTKVVAELRFGIFYEYLIGAALEMKYDDVDLFYNILK